MSIPSNAGAGTEIALYSQINVVKMNVENRNQLKGKEVQKLLQKIKRDIKTGQKSDDVVKVDVSEILKKMQGIFKA